jgi:hypothetical protein
VNSTPSTTSVQRAFSDLTISCRKDYMTGTQVLKSSTKSVAFGNIIAGGVIGAGVDMSTGAAYDYPSSVYIPLQ